MAGGADCRKTSFPLCRLHHPHHHAAHDAIRRDGKKSGLWPFKKSAVGGKKTAAYWTPLSGSPRGTSVSLCSCASDGVDVVVGRCGCRCRPVSMSLPAGVDVAVGRRATLWGITALLADWVTDMTHVMLFLAITCWAVGVAARLQTVIPTLAIIIAGSYHLIRELVPIVT